MAFAPAEQHDLLAAAPFAQQPFTALAAGLAQQALAVAAADCFALDAPQHAAQLSPQQAAQLSPQQFAHESPQHAWQSIPQHAAHSAPQQPLHAAAFWPAVDEPTASDINREANNIIMTKLHSKKWDHRARSQESKKAQGSTVKNQFKTRPAPSGGARSARIRLGRLRSVRTKMHDAAVRCSEGGPEEFRSIANSSRLRDRPVDRFQTRRVSSQIAPRKIAA